MSCDGFDEVETTVKRLEEGYSFSTSHMRTVESRPPVARMEPSYSQHKQMTSPSFAEESVVSLRVKQRKKPNLISFSQIPVSRFHTKTPSTPEETRIFFVGW